MRIDLAQAVYAGITPALSVYLGATSVWTGEGSVPAPNVYSGSSYRGPVAVEFSAVAGQLVLAFHGQEWGARADIVAPTGAVGEWLPVTRNTYSNNQPMILAYAGVVATSGTKTVTFGSTLADSWIHGHVYVFPIGSTVVQGVSAEGVVAFGATAPDVFGVAGDYLVCSALDSYHAGEPVDYVVADMTKTETSPIGQYSTFATAFQVVATTGNQGVRQFTTLPSLDEWAATSVVVRPPSLMTGAVISNLPTQPAAIVYGDVDFGAISSYNQPGSLVIAGRENYADAVFVTAASAGATVLLYIDAVIDNSTGTYHDLLHNASVYGAAIGRWPGDHDANGFGFLADFRPGSTIFAKLEQVLEQAVADNPHIGGFFADDLGTRSYFPLIDWGTWSNTDKLLYRRGAIELARVFRRVCDRHGLIFIVNGTWNGGDVPSLGGGYPSASATGCSLAEGGAMENWLSFDEAYRSQYAAGAQWANASPTTYGLSVMLGISPDATDRGAWVAEGTVAYVAQQADYGAAVAPWGSFHATNLPNGTGV